MGHSKRETESNPDSLTPIFRCSALQQKAWLAKEAYSREQPGYDVFSAKELVISAAGRD